MSRRARALALVALLATMTMATMTAVAQAQPPNHPPSRQADATVQRLLAREQPTIPNAGPAQAPSPVRPAEHNGQPSWLAPALAALAVVLTLSTGAAVLLTRRATRIQRADQTA